MKKMPREMKSKDEEYQHSGILTFPCDQFGSEHKISFTSIPSLSLYIKNYFVNNISNWLFD